MLQNHHNTNNLFVLTTSFVLILFTIFINKTHQLQPFQQTLLYPNTQASPSLYLFSFKLSKDLPASSYLLITLDWYPTDVQPYHCIFVNQSSTFNQLIQCTNLKTLVPAVTKTPSIDSTIMKKHNQYLKDDKTIVINMQTNTLTKNTEYVLQISLINPVPNIQKISPSIQFYSVSSQGLVYQENLNYGPVINKPPFNNLLAVSILNDLQQNQPGKFSSLKAQFTIAKPITTPLSSFVFVLPHPFKFTVGSIIKTYAAQVHSSNPIALYKAPIALNYKVLSSNIFTVTFNQSFVLNRKFQLQVTAIQNPFFLARSNFSIYSMNFGSLTPSQGFQNLYPIQTVTFPLTVTLGLPYDIPIQGPCQFYRNDYNYVQLKIVVPNSIPEGYAIRIYGTDLIIKPGTAYANFYSTAYDPIYQYDQSTYRRLVIKSMGSIPTGTIISISFKIYKYSNTNFNFDVWIDTQAVIKAQAALNYMFEGTVIGTSVDYDGFAYQFYDSDTNTNQRMIVQGSSLFPSYYMTVAFYPNLGSQDTSTGSYMDIYLPPLMTMEDTFNPNTDCNISGAAAVCTVVQTSNYLRITIKNANPSVNAFPQNNWSYANIKKIKITKTSSPKNIYPIYMRLYKTVGVGAIQYRRSGVIQVITVLNTQPGASIQTHGGTSGTGYTYPTFLRFEITDPTAMNYVINQNQQRVVTLFSYIGYKGLGASISNQGKYPCSSNIQVNCIYEIGMADSSSYQMEWQRIHILFPSGQQNTTAFHVVIPMTIPNGNANYYYYMAGIYNSYYKVKQYKYMDSYVYRSTWPSSPSNQQASMLVDMQGKAGSYRKNVTVQVVTNTTMNTLTYSFIAIVTKWSFYQQGTSSLTSDTLSLVNPQFGTQVMEPVSIYMGDNYYLTVIPFQYSPSVNSFTIHLDDVHMPYTYDLPDYHMFVTYSDNPPTTAAVSNINSIASYNEFILTNAGVFYQSPLKSLTVSCLDTSLGVLNTICDITFGTHHPLKANGTIRIVFSGMTVATDNCQLRIDQNGTKPGVSCSSTEDNANVTVAFTDLKNNYHYRAGNFTMKIHGIGIDSSSISHSFSLYVMDSSSLYVIQKGTRILTTTVINNKIIQLKEILYKYNSPLSANAISIKFSLPRQLYNDQDLGFIMGKDLSDVNTQINRLSIRLTNTDSALVLQSLYQLISDQYKVIFSFYDVSQLVAGNYTLQIFGIMTPASHQNGAFNIIYQRKYDKVYSLINQNSQSATFPIFNDLIISAITINSFYNTQGYDQQLKIYITNQFNTVDDKMVWIVNFPSYYIDKLFNYQPYCLIDGTPIECYADTNTPFQLVIKSSPKIIPNNTQYVISILGLACPRSTYMHNLYPNRYIFVGVLESETTYKYIETALLTPQQNIQSTVNGIITLTDIPLSNTNQPAFSSIFAVFNLFTNYALTSGSFFYIVFPAQFDNFNNKPLIITLSVPGFVPASINTTVVSRRVQFQIPASISSIPLNTAFTITFPSLPTPKIQSTVIMSQTSIFVTASDKKSIYAASMISGNSAPTLNFVKDPRYISFNSDNTIDITAGTYSSEIEIKSSDNNPFLNNIYVTLSSSGFTFQPANIFLSVGDKTGKFRVGADAGLLPISYFYSAIKTEQTISSYTITLNNNIRVTNTPININIPTSITIPIGGCSAPQILQLTNPPLNDVSITFSYDNQLYNENLFWPNHHTTKSEINFNSTVDLNYLSFCVASTYQNGTAFLPASFPLTLVLTGTNYASYKFNPSNIVTVNIVSQAAITTAPTISLSLINQQRTFLDISFTTNQQGNTYYHILRGKNQSPLSSSDLQIKIKNSESKIKSMNDFLTHIYLNDRDQRVGMMIQPAGSNTVRFSDMLPQTSYTFCVYLENAFNKISPTPVCQNYQTSAWGTITKVSLQFTKSLNDQQLNNVLCFFTKRVGTKDIYLINSQGNSCDNRKVKNLYYSYKGQSFSHEKLKTNLYLITNPYLVSDPSPTALQNMYDSSLALTSISLSAAVSFTINYMSSTYLIQSDARQMSAANFYQSTTNADASYPADLLSVSFDKPVYNSLAKKITISNVQILNGPGSIYFLLVLYKEIIKNDTQTYVNIRMNVPPTKQQVLNCLTWQNKTAQGCARAVYTNQAIQISFSSIHDNAMYILYYAAASDYPMRPVLSNVIANDTVVTYVFGCHLEMILVLLIIMAFLI